MTTTAPTGGAADLAERVRRGQTAEQLIQVGERTGWWTEEDVDRAMDGRLSELQEQLADAGVVDTGEGDVLARGLKHSDPTIRALAQRARDAIDELVTALLRRSRRG